jgi:hypothetical protein
MRIVESFRCLCSCHFVRLLRYHHVEVYIMRVPAILFCSYRAEIIDARHTLTRCASGRREKFTRFIN